ncbi:Hypothetical protein, fusion of predicted lipoprotein and IS1296 B transposase protein A [Mycoplasma mycoides subsp. capri LC str. 95010]|uniref:Insertion element IS150 protein InsJ-like helix-turn-helix domain-containing protein n=2 Tax=Mycoplasma mycoides subsp. capri LC str. 95010 TaxID=862259 RepID=F4MP68_MYCML|nr:Hypothetical protein, fusion of predicted lipoprotein and IS1296 B transposase protein A [Mycoplasma mycoides subsp. capri LC str. 95010]
MRKFNKLFLTILPISSISAFSVVSCTTNTKNNNQIPTIPNNKKPDNKPSENKPESTEEHTNKKPNENTNDQKQPNNSEKSDAKSNPGKPENKPNNSHNPKQPKQPEHNDPNSNNTTDNNNSTNNDEPQADQPQHNQGDDSSNNTEEIFSDIDALKKEIEFNFYTTYKNKDALTSWIEIKSRKQAIFKEVIFSRNIDILEKYQIEFDSQNDPEIIKEKGIISNVKIKFTKNGKSKVYEFTFTGFKKENKIDSKISRTPYSGLKSRKWGFYMSKLNLEKKLKIVKEAKKLNIKKSTYIANKYDISVKTVESLVNRFEAFGIEGLINKEKKPYYSAKLKLKVVLYKLETNQSYDEVAKKFNIIYSSTIAGWVKKYREYGFLGLNNNIGRPKKIMKNPNKKPAKIKKSQVKIDKEQQIKELKEQVEYYKLEAEFWKKFHALLTKERSTRKKQK